MNKHLGRVDAPPLVRPGGFGVALGRRPHGEQYTKASMSFLVEPLLSQVCGFHDVPISVSEVLSISV
jgi:hypothetical protein